ncbi:MAG TPA: hypothetical protein VFP34_19135 [Microlunatus sp.]|nr:hypothetical protein [Microlunatus sp.]
MTPFLIGPQSGPEPPEPLAPDLRPNAQRPLLRPGLPVLRRRGAVQLGIDTPDSVVLDPAPPAMARWLALADGRRTREELLDAAVDHGMAAAVAASVIDRLAGAGVIVDRPAAARGGVVRLIGAGPLGRAIAGLLVKTDLERIELVDDDPRCSKRSAAGLREILLAERATMDVRQPDGPPSEHSTHNAVPGIDALPAEAAIGETATRSGVSAAAPSVTVIAPDAMDVDRALTDALVRAGRTHLLVRAPDTSTVVGPFVIPGRTSCVRCSDLQRRSADPDWALVLAQLCRTQGQPAPWALGWAAGTVVALIDRVLSGATAWPELSGATVELGRAGVPLHRRWPRHPDCCCARLGTTDHIRAIGDAAA